MENASPDTYLTGQPLKADTFAEQRRPSFESKILVFTSLSNLANREVLPATVNKENASDDIKGADFICSPPVGGQLRTEPVARLTPRQAWEGTVVECRADSFLARVTDQTNSANPDELVTFDLDEISEDDRQMVKAGSSFYWTIGTEKSPAGQIKNIDMVIFRRLPRWKNSALRRAEQDAKEAMRLLFS
jgi:hypothetical protein